MLDFDTAKIYTNFFPHNNIDSICKALKNAKKKGKITKKAELKPKIPA